MCRMKKLKGLIVVLVLFLMYSLFVSLTLDNVIGYSTWQYGLEQLTDPNQRIKRSTTSVAKLDTIFENELIAEVVYMDKNDSLVARTNPPVTQRTRNIFDQRHPSQIPLNRSAFGKRYELSKQRSAMYDFPFTIDGREICQEVKEPFLVIILLSVHTHVDTRTAIRNSWGRSSNPGVWPRVGDLKQKVKLVFLFGKPKNDLESKIVTEESKMYGDIVQANFEDSYFNLTYKTLTGLRWVAEYCPGAKYILKTDEDVFVHVHNLITFLSSQKPKQRTIYGHVIYNSDVIREGRWGVSKHAFPFDIYPFYTCGNTYVIPGSLATDLFYTAGLLPYLNIEDVFITGVLRSFIKATIVDVIGFTHWFEKRPKPCEFKNTIRISATKVTDYMQYELWEGIKQQKLKDCYKVIRVVHVKTKRPDGVVQQLVRDDHIYMNKTNGDFYIL